MAAVCGFPVNSREISRQRSSEVASVSTGFPFWLFPISCGLRDRNKSCCARFLAELKHGLYGFRSAKRPVWHFQLADRSISVVGAEQFGSLTKAAKRSSRVCRLRFVYNRDTSCENIPILNRSFSYNSPEYRYEF